MPADTSKFFASQEVYRRSTSIPAPVLTAKIAGPLDNAAPLFDLYSETTSLNRVYFYGWVQTPWLPIGLGSASQKINWSESKDPFRTEI